METNPKVSVIMPVVRSDLGAQALESLFKQKYAGEIEIIVVGACADELANQWPIIPVNYGLIRDPGKARNLGALYATGEILLFLDDDCKVLEYWVEQNVQALKQPEVGAVGACIRSQSPTFLARSTDYINFGYYQHNRSMDITVASASMSITKEVFNAIKGFDETKQYGEDEDVDLCYRIQQLGYRTVYNPNIKVIHNHRRETLSKILSHNHKHGKFSGLTTKVIYHELELKNQLLFRVRSPFLFLFLFPLVAIAATVRITVMNFLDHPDILLHLPIIFLAKLVYEFGILQRLLSPSKKA